MRNPSFEDRDASCNPAVTPWTTVGGYANADLGAEDGVIYFTMYTNAGHFQQAITSGMDGLYTLSMYWRPTYWSDGSGFKDSCMTNVTWNDQLLWSNTLRYGSQTTYGWTQLQFGNLTYSQASGGAFRLGVQCTSNARYGSDYDNIVMALQS